LFLNSESAETYKGARLMPGALCFAVAFCCRLPIE
jgi:hypothetical protein